MIKRLTLITLVCFSVSGCSALLTAWDVAGSGTKPIVGSAQIGSNQYKASGIDQKSTTTDGDMVGGQEQKFQNPQNVTVNDTAKSYGFWYTMMIIIGCLGWMAPMTPQEIINKLYNLWVNRSKTGVKNEQLVPAPV